MTVKINCKTPILNFKNEEMSYETDNGGKIKDSIGRQISDQLLMATLEPQDDPLEVYDAAKLFYSKNEVEISDEQAKRLYKFISRCNIPTLVKGQSSSCPKNR